MRRAGLTAVTAAAGLTSGVLARRGTVWGEVAATEALNELPASVIDGLAFLSELGTVSTVAIVAVVVFVVADGNRILQAAMVATSGLLASWVASILDSLVDRPAPGALGADVQVREAVAAGWPSTHVAIATALLVAATLASRRRIGVALLVGAIVGVARMAVGVQLPLDVIGGLAVGTGAALVGVGALESLSLPAVRLRRPASTTGTG